MNRYITLTALALLCIASFSAGVGEVATVLAAASLSAAECHPDAVYQLYLMQAVAWLGQRRNAQGACIASVSRLTKNDEWKQTAMNGATALRRKPRSTRRGPLRARRLARFIVLAYVLVAVAISVALCACALLLMGPVPAFAAWP